MPEATIIGAGPAGSAAAFLLARAGWHVTLLEQHRFPRDKVCGECLSTLGMDVLARLGLRDELLGKGAVELTHVAIHSLSGRSVRFALPRPMWGISRRVLDSALLDAARKAGSIVRQPVRCESIGPGPILRVRDLVSNAMEVLQPDHLIVADGKGSLQQSPPPPTGDFGIKAHFEAVNGPRDTIELFGCRGFYGGLAAIEGNRWNVAWSVPARPLRDAGGDVAAVFDQIIESHPVLRHRVAGARQVGEWLASRLPRFAVRDDWPAGVIPVGNAAAAVEPIGGEGMGLALRSAEMAADSVCAAKHTCLCTAYRTLWNTRSAGCRAAALVVSRPRVARLVVPAIDISKPGRAAALWAMGK